MATKTKKPTKSELGYRLIVTLPHSYLAFLRQYQKENGLVSEQEAFRSLAAIGANHVRSQQAAVSVDGQMKQMLPVIKSLVETEQGKGGKS